LIPFEEFNEFPFTGCGMNSADHIYHYDKNGKVIDG